MYLNLAEVLNETTQDLKASLQRSIDELATEHQEYSQLCRHQGKKIVVMGVSFSSQERNIATWQGELLDEHGALIRKLAPEAKQ